MRNLMTDPERLWGTLMETAAIGGTAKGGICRLTLTDLDRQVRDWFRSATEALGCSVTVDDMGTMFARREGQRRDVPPIAIGSHLDTQPTGGKFDGTLGVLAALEVLRTLQQAGYETFAPIEVVNWTNEEGSRFTPPMLASGVFAGVFTRDWAYSRADPAGVSFGSALAAIGQRGPQRCGDHPLSAFFELHIEQGPILEAEGIDIGAVTGVQGIRWFEVTVTGQDAHTGATPMHLRKNALLGAARIVRAGGGDRAGARAGGSRDRGVDAGEAELAQRRTRRSLPDHRHAPSRVTDAGGYGGRRSTRRLPPWANRSGFRSRRQRSGISRL